MRTLVRPPGPVADGLTIALLGGSFDPAHAGHLHISLAALRGHGVDYVWWLVTPGSPLKPPPTPLVRRVTQAQAVARHPRIRVCALEQELGTRFTIDTLRALRRRFPRIRFVWLMGSDNLQQFSRWRAWADIARLVPVMVAPRPGSAVAAASAVLMRRFGQARRLEAPPCILVLGGPRSDASSTALRAHMGVGKGLGVIVETMLNPLL